MVAKLFFGYQYFPPGYNFFSFLDHTHYGCIMCISWPSMEYILNFNSTEQSLVNKYPRFVNGLMSSWKSIDSHWKFHILYEASIYVKSHKNCKWRDPFLYCLFMQNLLKPIANEILLYTFIFHLKYLKRPSIWFDSPVSDIDSMWIFFIWL